MVEGADSKKLEKTKVEPMKLDIKQKIQEYMRVLKITKKPANPEYSAAIKITGLGILIIGAIGLIIYIIAKLTGYIPSSI